MFREQVVIADTGPIHYLILIGQVALLPALFTRVIIPEAVRNEMLDPKTPIAVRQWITAPPEWFQVLPDPAVPIQDLTLDELDDGERAAIQLALSMQAALLLMDDRAGVYAARHRGLIVTGTLGVLRLAAIANLVNLKEALNSLMATNFRYSPILINRLLEDFQKND